MKFNFNNITDIVQDAGACSICGAEGVTKATCPKNPSAKNPKPEKHVIIKKSARADSPKKDETLSSSKDKITSNIDKNWEFHKNTKLFMLSGPNEVTYFNRMKLLGEKGPGRNILLLGESHTFTPDCESKDNLSCFQNWIDYISKNSPYCVDFFLEGTTKLFSLDAIKPLKPLIYRGTGGNELGDIKGRNTSSQNPNIIYMTRDLFTPHNMGSLKNTRFHSVDLRLINDIMDSNGEKIQTHKSLMGYEVDFNDNKDFLSTLRKDIESYIVEISSNKSLKKEVTSQIKSVGTLKVFIDLLISVQNMSDFTKLYKYDIINDLILADNPKMLDNKKYTIKKILNLHNREEQKLLNKYIKNLTDPISKKYIDNFNMLLKREAYKIKDINNHIINIKYVIERQLSKSLLTKKNFIDNKDIWFRGREKYTHILHFAAQMFIMDIYTLSRMFAIFDENKLNRGPIKCRDPIYKIPRNIIFYGGNLHTFFYKEFIDRFNSINTGKNFSYFTGDEKKHIQFNRLDKKYKNGFDFFSDAI